MSAEITCFFSSQVFRPRGPILLETDEVDLETVSRSSVAFIPVPDLDDENLDLKPAFGDAWVLILLNENWGVLQRE